MQLPSQMERQGEEFPVVFQGPEKARKQFWLAHGEVKQWLLQSGFHAVHWLNIIRCCYFDSRFTFRHLNVSQSFSGVLHVQWSRKVGIVDCPCHLGAMKGSHVHSSDFRSSRSGHGCSSGPQHWSCRGTESFHGLIGAKVVTISGHVTGPFPNRAWDDAAMGQPLEDICEGRCLRGPLLNTSMRGGAHTDLKPAPFLSACNAKTPGSTTYILWYSLRFLTRKIGMKSIMCSS